MKALACSNASCAGFTNLQRRAQSQFELASPNLAVELWSWVAWCWLIVRTLNLASQAGFYCCLVLWAAPEDEMLVQA